MTEQNKPDLTKVLELVKLKEQTKELYAEIDEITRDLMARYGQGRFDYDLGDIDDLITETPEILEFVLDLKDGGRYLKFEIQDNIGKLAEAGSVWKSTAFKAVSFSHRILKNIPTSLK